MKTNLLGAAFFALIAGSFRLSAQAPTHENCGVNSALVVLNRFGIEAEPKALVSTLGVGSNLSNPTNFEALSDLFKQKGLYCYKFKGASLAEVIELLNMDTLALIQTQKPPWEHFFVFGKREDGAIRVDDYPHLNLIVGRDLFESKQERAFTGNVLIISKSSIEKLDAFLSSKSTTAGYVPAEIDSERKEGTRKLLETNTPTMTRTSNLLKGQSLVLSDLVELGEVSSRSKEVTAWCEVQNRSKNEVTIQKISGSCSCYLGPVPFDRVIKPDSVVKIGFRFDPRKMISLSSGEISSSLVLETSDPDLAIVKIQVHGRVVMSFAWGFMPANFDWGSVPKSRKTKYSEFALLASKPIDATNLEIINENASDLDCKLYVFPKGEVKKLGPFTHYGFLKASLLAPPTGPFKYTIKVRNKLSGEVEYIEMKGVGYAE